MKGFGSFGHGGHLPSPAPSSSSSSSLSPLAPPFTVDRPNPKPNSNPVLQLPDPCYNNWDSLQSFDSTHATIISLLDLETDSTRITCLPLSNDYQCQDPHSMHPPSTHWSSLNPRGQSVTDGFLYSGESQPYYDQYVSPTGDDNTQLSAINHPNYDLSATTGLLSMNSASTIKYDSGLSVLDHTTQWGSFWNGLGDDNRGKKIPLEGGCLEDSSPLVYNNSMNKGNFIGEDVAQHEKLSALLLGNNFDAFSRKKYAASINTKQLDDGLFSGEDVSLISFGSAKNPTIKTQSVNAHSHAQASCLESASTSSCTRVTKPSPAVVIRPPGNGTFTPSTASSRFMETGNIKTYNDGACNVHKFSGTEDPFVCPDAEYFRSCFDATDLSEYQGKNRHTNVDSSQTTGEKLHEQLTIGTVGNLNELEGRSGNQGPNIINSLPALSSIIVAENTMDSLDHHNTAVDSPCWKGSSGINFSSIEVATLSHVTNTFEASNTLNIAGAQMFSACSESANAPCQKYYENSSLNESCAENQFPLSEKRCLYSDEMIDSCRSSDDEKLGESGSSRKGVQYTAGIENSGKYEFLGAVSGACEQSSTSKLRLEERSCKSTEIKKQNGDAENAIRPTDGSEDDKFSLVVNNGLEQLSLDEDNTDFIKPQCIESVSKMDVKIVTNTMYNLSELLQFYCSVSRPLEEHNRETLKRVINNLQACLSKNDGHVASITEPIFCSESTSAKGSGAKNMVLNTGFSQLTTKTADVSVGQLNSQCIDDGEVDRCASGRKIGAFVNYKPLKNDEEIQGADYMVQTIKMVLEENFHVESEIESDALLYKNLWLEAEAQLCTSIYRSRFDRVKNEMMNRKLKKAEETTMLVEKSVSSEGLDNPNVSSSVLVSENNSGQELETIVENSLVSGVIDAVDDIDASVMARLRILKCRGENPKPISTGELPHVASGGFRAKRNRMPVLEDQVEDGATSLVAAKPPSLREDVAIKESGVCIPEVQLAKNDKQNIQLPFGWYDNTSSDWEKVLKDDYAFQNQ